MYSNEYFGFKPKWLNRCDPIGGTRCVEHATVEKGQHPSFMCSSNMAMLNLVHLVKFAIHKRLRRTSLGKIHSGEIHDNPLTFIDSSNGQFCSTTEMPSSESWVHPETSIARILEQLDKYVMPSSVNSVQLLNTTFFNCNEG